ncbi:MAG: hypothetical protein HQM09_17070 [Candidatus Riflebacteria bacterium]|nr:hypothetical protein [Candidatus Riflebacteria bacterium]
MIKLIRGSLAKVFAGGVLISTFCLLTLITGCGSKKDLPERIRRLAETSDHSVIRIGIMGDARELGPSDVHDRSGRFLSNLINAGPLRLTPRGEFTPDLWKQFNVATDADGNLTVEGEWRDGIVWHDGVPVTLEDLQFTIDRLRDAQSNSPLTLLAKQVKNIESLDSGKKCRVTFTGTSRQYLHLLGSGLLPSHLLRSQKVGEEKIALLDGDEPGEIISGFAAPPASCAEMVNASQTGLIASSSQKSHIMDFTEIPVGAGAFRVVSRKLHSYLELAAGPIAASSMAANPASASKRVLIVFYQAPDELVSDIRKGHIDLAFLPSEFAQRLQELKIPGVRLVSSPNPSYLMLGFNTHKPPFDKLEVRRAIDFAINRKALAATFPYSGKILSGPPLGSDDLRNSFASRGYDLTRASELLSTAGVTDSNGDGRRELDGKALELTLFTNGDNFVRKQLCDQIADDLKKIGIFVTVEVRDWSQLINKTLPEGTWSMFLLGFHAPPDGNWINLWSSNTPIGVAASLSERLNFTGFSTQELDLALSAIDTLPEPSDIAARKDLVARTLYEQIPGVFLLQPLDYAVVSEGLTGFISDGDIFEQDVAAWERVPVASAGH